jgi:hypothetical protein
LANPTERIAMSKQPTAEVPDLGTRTNYQACQLHGEITDGDELAGKWTGGVHHDQIWRACPKCGAWLVDKVRVTYPRVQNLEEMEVGGTYYCVDTYHDKEAFDGQIFELVEGPHECRAYGQPETCLTGRVLRFGPDARKTCIPVRYFGLDERGPDFYSTYRVR